MGYVYFFLPGRVDGHKGLAHLLGNKGAHLAEMSRMGLPIPPGFTISTEAFRQLHTKGTLPLTLKAEVEEAMETLGRTLGFGFGDPRRPLLVSVRSGAAVSMPGMMATVSNIGLTSRTLAGLAAATHDPRFAYDTFRRLLETYTRAVIEQPTIGEAERDARAASFALAEHFQQTLDATRTAEDELSAEQLELLCRDYLRIIGETAPAPFPDDAFGQLWGAVVSVFRSWDGVPAKRYRERVGIPHELGTAVTVQAMVFGNLGESSGAGVLFTRDPVEGVPEARGEWLPNAQGDDVVGGYRTPHWLSAGDRARGADQSLSAEEQNLTLEVSMPEAFGRLLELAKLLEAHYRRPQEIEFIIQEGRLWVLQTRGTELSRLAAVRAAVEMVREGLIGVEEALEMTAEIPLEDILWSLAPGARKTAFARGIPSSPGVATGAVALTADRAEEYARVRRRAVLICDHIAPEDIHGVDAAAALVANRGGISSHLAVTARGWGKPCVVGCGTLKFDLRRGTLSAGGFELKEGDEVTVDGGGGLVYAGRLRRRRAGGEFEEYVRTLREWRHGRESREDGEAGGS